MRTREIVGLDPRSRRSLRVTVQDGTIANIEETKEQSDLYLSAGLVDLQVNGYAGLDLNSADISIEIVTGLVSALLAQGVTCFAPTLISASEESICRALRLIAQARKSDPKAAACIPCVHVEGPHISPLDGYRGAHPAEAIRPPSLAEFDNWQNAGDGLVGIVTLSPHFVESSEYIAALAKRGVQVALGHTHATPEQISRAADAGAKLSTHLGNGIASPIPRHCNAIWPQLADDRLSATFIADGHHLPAYVLNAMLRAKGVEHSLLVSDSVALAGMPQGIYPSLIGGCVELRQDGELCIFGSDLLAGSTASLLQCVGRALQMTGLPLPDVLAMATSNPGRFVGGRGQLTVGARADLLRFRLDSDIRIADVWLAGNSVISQA